MSGGPSAIFRARILRAVVNVSPCTPYRVADDAALTRVCERLVDAEEALDLLRQNGYREGATLTEAVRALMGLESPKAINSTSMQDISDIWTSRG